MTAPLAKRIFKGYISNRSMVNGGEGMEGKGVGALYKYFL